MKGLPERVPLPEHNRPAQTGLEHTQGERFKQCRLVVGASTPDLIVVADTGGVVASGPGSFTGLRVGLAAIKALAEVLAKPIAAVSLLEVLALTGGAQGRVIAALDAGRGDVYAGEYEIASDAATLLHEQVQTKEELLLIAQQSAPAASIVTSDQPLAETMKAAAIPVTLVEILHAGSIAASIRRAQFIHHHHHMSDGGHRPRLLQASSPL